MITLVNAVHFRISLENVLNIKMDNKEQAMKLLTKIFGLSDAPEYQYEISQKIRKVYPVLKNEVLKMMGIENL